MRRGEGEEVHLPQPRFLIGTSFFEPSCLRKREEEKAAARPRAAPVQFLGQMSSLGRWLYLDRVGDDEISLGGPTELQCLWFGPLRVCPQLFLFALVLPQVFQIECLHSCFCSFRNQAQESQIQASFGSTSLCQEGQRSCNCCQK